MNDARTDDGRTRHGTTSNGTASIKSSSEIAFRLDDLLQRGSIVEAVSLAVEHPLHEEWCDLAVRALLYGGLPAEAEGIIKWAKGLEARLPEVKCSVAFAESTLAILAGEAPSEYIVANPEGRLMQVLDLLREPTASIKSRGLRTRLDEKVITLSIDAARRLGDSNTVKALAVLLWQKFPIPTALGNLTLAGQIEPLEGLPDRLLNDYPDEIQIAMLAAALETDVYNNPEKGLSIALKLLQASPTQADRDNLARIILVAASRLGRNATSVLSEEVLTLLGSGSRWQKIFEIQSTMDLGNLEVADKLLNSIRDEDNPDWLQAKAMEAARANRKAEAAKWLFKCGEITSDYRFVDTAAALAFDGADFELALKALNRLLKHRPKDAHVLQNIGAASAARGDSIGAAAAYRQAFDLDAENDDVLCLYAHHEALAGDQRTAISILDKHRKPGTEGLRVLLTAAAIEHSLGNAEGAFLRLKQRWGHFCNSPEFLLTYMTIGYAAGHDDEGDKALHMLHELQATKALPHPVLQAVSVDEVADEISRRADQHQRLLQDLIRGGIAWLHIDGIASNPYYWAWRLRTQPLRLPAENPYTLPNFVVPATNQFEISTRTNGDRWLTEVAAVDSNDGIIIDVTSLTTFHRLGLLQVVADHARQIVLPTTYSQIRSIEGSRIAPIQPSRVTASETALAMISEGKIRLTQPTTDVVFCLKDDGESLPGATPVSVASLTSALRISGKLDESSLTTLARTATEGEASDANEIPLGSILILGQLMIGLLADAAALSAVVETFDTRVTEETRERLASQLRGYSARQEVQKWHNSLWDYIKLNDNFEYSAKFERHITDVPWYDSASLALASGLPLIADDRALAMLVANSEQPGAKKISVCDSSNYLIYLWRLEKLSLDTLSTAFHDLIRWRYLFLLPPAEVMQSWANSFPESVPGAKLELLAQYVHFCFRSRLLFPGFEDTKPKTSMATQMLQTWCYEIGAFLTLVWSDPDCSEVRRKALSEWACAEMLPSLPYSLSHLTPAIEYVPKLLLTGMLIKAFDIRRRKETNEAIRFVKVCLGLPDDTFEQILTEVADIAKG